MKKNIFNFGCIFSDPTVLVRIMSRAKKERNAASGWPGAAQKFLSETPNDNLDHFAIWKLSVDTSVLIQQ